MSEKALNYGGEFLTIGKGFYNSMAEKTVILEKWIRQFSLKLSHYEARLFWFFNPWKSTFSSSSLRILSLYIK